MSLTTYQIIQKSLIPLAITIGGAIFFLTLFLLIGLLFLGKTSLVPFNTILWIGCPIWTLFVMYTLLLNPIYFLKQIPLRHASRASFTAFKNTEPMKTALEESQQLFERHLLPLTRKIALVYFSGLTILFFYHSFVERNVFFAILGITSSLFLLLSIKKRQSIDCRQRRLLRNTRDTNDELETRTTSTGPTR